jgi:hypothetical protein
MLEIAEVGEIIAGGEIGAGAGDHDGAQAVVLSGFFERGDQRDIHFAVEGVLLFGAVEEKAQDAFLPRRDDLIRLGVSPRARSEKVDGLFRSERAPAY